MDWIIKLVSFLIASLHGMWQTAIAPTYSPTDNQTSPTANDIMDIPSGLLIGASISAFQHEGAWNTSDKAVSRMDRRYEGHPTANFYYKYKEDIDLLKNIGFDSFRFSLCWARLLPNGTSDYISEDGLRFYNNVINELKARGIEPIVTIYHWDHPQTLEDQGGWFNEKMLGWFANYSRVVFEKFGDRVKYFTTINQPKIYCTYLRLSGIPIEVAKYKCHQNMLKAHALAYHIYGKEFRHLYNGQVGIIELCDANYPYSEDDKDLEAQQIAYEFNCGWTLNPIFSKKGDYPEIMKTRIAERSKLQGYNESRLPELSSEWINIIKNSADFYGLNLYSSWRVKQSNEKPLSWPNDEGIDYSFHPSWTKTDTNYSRIFPQGLGDVLRRIRDNYNNKPVYILENGVALKNGINDDLRIDIFYAYLKEIVVAITRDKCDVRMYSFWSFLDGFEWIVKEGSNFGIVQVDYNDPDRKRTPKKSALWFKAILAASSSGGRKLLPPGNWQF